MIDTSALIAIHWHEPERETFREALAAARRRVLPATVWVEFATVTRARAASRLWLDDLIARQNITIQGIDAEIAGIAVGAVARYGRGSGNPAQLNFGDCLSYAVAKRLDAPLLFKGDDFGQTDIRSAVAA